MFEMGLVAMNMEGQTGAGSTFGYRAKVKTSALLVVYATSASTYCIYCRLRNFRCWRDHVTEQRWDGFPYAVAANSGDTDSDVVSKMVVCPNSIDANADTVRQPWSKPADDDDDAEKSENQNDIFPSNKKPRTDAD